MPHQIRSDDLMALARPDPANRDAALLRATTSLFCQDPVHDRDSLRRYEQLATYFLPRAPIADRVFVAELLAARKDAPEAVIRILARDEIEVAAPVLRHSPVLSHIDLLGVIGATGPDHHRLIAARDHLHPDVVKALSLAGAASTAAPAPAVERPPMAHAETDAAAPTPAGADGSPLRRAHHPLAPASPHQVDTATAPAQPAAAIGVDGSGRRLPPLPARSPFARPAPKPAALRPHPLAPPLAPAAETGFAGAPIMPQAMPDSPLFPPPPPPADLPTDAPQPRRSASEGRREGLSAMAVAGFLKLDPAGRLRLIADVAARRARTAGRSLPGLLDEAVHIAFNRTKIVVSARRGDRQGLIAGFAAVTGISLASIGRLVEDASGEALVLLIRAAGLSEADGRTVLLLANPAIGESVETFPRLADLLAGMEKPVADGFVAAWRDKAVAAPVHVPVEADATGVRSRGLAERSSDTGLRPSRPATLQAG